MKINNEINFNDKSLELLEMLFYNNGVSVNEISKQLDLKTRYIYQIITNFRKEGLINSIPDLNSLDMRRHIYYINNEKYNEVKNLIESKKYKK